jgi:hypothetical protein
VRYFGKTWFLLMALSWLPLSAHCQLERVPGLEFLQCAADAPSEDGSRNDCGDRGCCPAEKAPYKSEQHRVGLPSPGDLPVAFAPTSDIATTPPSEVSPAIPLPGPPELRQSWHFSFRAASSPRAPSFAS